MTDARPRCISQPAPGKGSAANAIAGGGHNICLQSHGAPPRGPERSAADIVRCVRATASHFAGRLATSLCGSMSTGGPTSLPAARLRWFGASPCVLPLAGRYYVKVGVRPPASSSAV